MNNTESFSYDYSARKNKEAERIRARYIDPGYSDIDRLRELDRRVGTPPRVFAWIFGSIAAIIMGCGMSLIMTDISDIIGITVPYAAGIAIGVLGMIMAIVNYPIYERRLSSRRRRYADEILSLSDKIINSQDAQY